MKIKCPECQQSYEIPDRFYGKKFYCPKCQTRVRTKPLEVGDVTAVHAPLADTAHESTASSSSPRRRHAAFQKEPAPKPLISSFSLQQICMTIGFVGIAVALIVVLSALGGNSTRAVPDDTTETARADQESPSDGATEGERVGGRSIAGDGMEETGHAMTGTSEAGGNRSRSTAHTTFGAESSRDRNRDAASRRNVDQQLTVDMGPGASVRLNPDRAGGGILGPVPLMDITWHNNGPAFSLRLLDSEPLSGMAMEKVVRTYGSPAFLERYRSLLDSDDYTVRFYASLGLANFGQADEQALSILLKSIAQSRSRNAYRLRVDLANEVIGYYRSRIIPVLQNLVSDDDPEVAGFAVEYLALMGRDARGAVPDIARLVDRHDLYLPYNESQFHTLKLGDLARAALRRLAIYAADAIPVLQERMEQEKDPQTRQQILELIAWIGYKSGQGEEYEWPVWARNYGIPLMPVDVRSIVAFRMTSFRNASLDTLPQIARVLESLEQTTGIPSREVDLITLATWDQGRSLWERRPFMAIVRMNAPETIDRIPLGPEQNVDGQKIRGLTPDIGWQITGERTLVVGTIPELVNILNRSRSERAAPSVVIPHDDREPAYLNCSATESHAIYVSEPSQLVGRVEREFRLPQIAADAETMRREINESADQNTGDTTAAETVDWWAARTERPETSLRRSGSRLFFEFPLTRTDIATAPWLDSLPWRPSNGTALRVWNEFRQGLRIARAPYTDAAGLVRPEMGDVNDVDRDQINEIIRWCLAEEKIGPTTRLPMDAQERRNRMAWARYALRWAEGQTLGSLTHLLNAMQLESAEAISLLLESRSPEALTIIADWAARNATQPQTPGLLSAMAARIDHELAIRNPESLDACIRLCDQYPEVAMAVLPRLQELADSTNLDPEVSATLVSVLRRESTFQLPEADYEKMNDYAAESGMANAGLGLGLRFRGAPPTVKRLEPWLHPARTFEVLVPYVHPDLVTVEMDGPVNEYADDYSRIDGLRFFIARGDVVTVSRRRADMADPAADWQMTSEYLGGDLVRDDPGPTSATFDRYRLYIAQGIPKGQRDLIVDDWLYEIRWIGRNRSRFPAYVRDILFSLKPRALEADEASEESESPTDDAASQDPARLPATKNRPKAKLNAPGIPDSGDIDRNQSSTRVSPGRYRNRS